MIEREQVQNLLLPFVQSQLWKQPCSRVTALCPLPVPAAPSATRTSNCWRVPRSSRCDWGTSGSYGNNQGGERRGRNGMCSFRDSWSSALLYSGLCHSPAVRQFFPSSQDQELQKHRKTPHWLADLPLGFLHIDSRTLRMSPAPGRNRTRRPYCTARDLMSHFVHSPLFPHSHTIPGQAALSKNGDSGLLPHLVKSLIPSAFCEEIYTAECRVVSTKTSSDSVCPASGNTPAVSPSVLLFEQLSYCRYPGWPGHSKLIHIPLHITTLPLPFRYTKNLFTGSDGEGSNWKKQIPWTRSSTHGCEAQVSPASLQNTRMRPLLPY